MRCANSPNTEPAAMSSLSEAIAFALQGAAMDSARRPLSSSGGSASASSTSRGGTIVDASGTSSENASSTSSSGGGAASSTSSSGAAASGSAAVTTGTASATTTSSSGSHSGAGSARSSNSHSSLRAAVVVSTRSSSSGNSGVNTATSATAAASPPAPTAPAAAGGALSAALKAAAAGTAAGCHVALVHFQSDRDDLALPTLIPLIAELISATAAKNSFRYGLELAATPPTLFHAPDYQIPRVTIFAFLDRMATYMGCSSNCFVLALVIIDALLFKRGADVRYLLVPSSMHRLVLGSVVVAIKFLEDSFRSNRFYAKVGGIDVGEFNRIESLLVFELDYELLSIASHFHRYSERLHYLVSSSAAARAAQPDARPTWHIDLRSFFSFSERRLLRAGSSSDLVSRLRNQRMAGTATALAALSGGMRPSSQSSVAALVGSPKPRHTSLRAASTNTTSTIAAPRSSSPSAASALLHTTSLPGGAGTAALKTSSASPKASHKSLRASSGHAPASVGAALPAAEIGGGSATDSVATPPAPKRTSPVALVRTSQSPPSDLDRSAKLKRVQSSELTIDVFRTRAAPPARRISSSPAQLGPNGGRLPLARSQLALVSTIVSTSSAQHGKQRRLRRHVSLDDFNRNALPVRHSNSSPSLRVLSSRSISSHGSDTP